MASLMKKLFDTMPLAGVEGALREAVGDMKTATVGQLAQHLKFHETPPAVTVESKRPDDGMLAAMKGFLFDWDSVPIWGYQAPGGDPTRVNHVTCRVREDGFNNYLVLDEIAWGHAPTQSPESFSNDVEVVLQKTTLTLPLNDKFHLMSFTTKDGYNNPKQLHWLWPIEARHDEALLHVFVYDIVLPTPAPRRRSPER